MNRFTENLDRLLYENHMTRAELATRIGVGKSTVTAWFNKSCDGVRLDTLLAIAEMFHVSLDELVRGIPDNRPQMLSSEEIAQLKKMLKDARR